MDELLRDFLTETHESLDTVDSELVRFEQEPNNAEILANIFRLVHTIKGTCGFLNLPRLAALAHAAENLMSQFRAGLAVTPDAVSLVLETLDRIKAVLDALEAHQAEPAGTDDDLIARLDAMAQSATGPAPSSETGTLVYQVLERPLKPGEATLDELERAFRETPGPAAAKVSPGTVQTPDRHDPKVANQSIRVNVDTLEHLMNMVSELVLTRNQLMELARRQAETTFKQPLQRLSHVTAELQESVMKTRMQPIGNAWQKLPRLMRDLSAELGKDIEIEMQGAETELDRQILDMLRDPLTHMLRNSADHGIETAEERRACGKPARATIRLCARHEGGHIIIEVSDDGRGLDIRKIRDRVLASGLVSEADLDKMPDVQVQRFIFLPGMSTAETVTAISGRGVGMDVVQSNIDKIGGTIDVKSVPGQGTVFTIRIPLTLAIVSALIVEAAGDRFAIPQVAVMELVRVRAQAEHRIERIKDAPVLRLRNKLLPLTFLRKILKIGEPDQYETEQGFVVIMQVGPETFGMVVDRVFHTEEIVVKPLASKLRHIQIFSGNTILGDGAVIMILDPNGIAASFGSLRGGRVALESAADTVKQAAESNKTALLIFRAGSNAPRAVPLSLVTRLEEIDVARIEMTGERHVVQYRGRLMPVIFPGACVRLKESGSQPLLVFSEGSHAMALAVDQIVDIVEGEFEIEVSDDRPGILGSAIVKGEATDIVDVGHYLPIAHADWLGGGRRHPTRQHVLLVDDSAFFRNMLSPVLRAAGFAVTAASSGHEAIGLIRSGRAFDLVVTDLEMPGMDGIALARALRAESTTAHVPMIALSSMATPETIARVRRAGFHDFVAKFDRQGLIAAIKEQSGAMTERAA
ncbi:chemotaxis protein CheW [Pseudorhodoplanes sp.]|uniref:hybrid sensor histidine kinase/response regulator n=1 Tax=Pseudorhodoplanes sp. TaxID=1934341 RepID=UPI003919C741